MPRCLSKPRLNELHRLVGDQRIYEAMKHEVKTPSPYASNPATCFVVFDSFYAFTARPEGCSRLFERDSGRVASTDTG